MQARSEPKVHLADAVQGAEQDLVQVAVVQQVGVVVDHVLHHGVHLQALLGDAVGSTS